MLSDETKTTQYQTNPTEKQIKTTNNILAGEQSVGQAMRNAGYSTTSSLNPGKNFMEAKGTKTYLSRLDLKSRIKFNMCTVDRALEVFMEALEAKKYIPFRVVNEGNKVIYKTQSVPDHDIRIRAADKLLKLHSVENLQPEKESSHSQTLTQEEIDDFNKKFLRFIESGEFSSTVISKSQS